MLYPISTPKPNSARDLVGYIDTRGRVIVSPTYSGGSYFFEGKASVVDKHGQSGFVDLAGNLVLPCRFQGLGKFKNGLCSINGGFIDHSGHWFIEPRFLVASSFSEGNAFASTDGDTFGFIDLSGNFVVHPEYEECRQFRFGLAAVSREGRWGYIDHNGEIRIPLVFEGSRGGGRNGIAIVQMDGLWGFIDESGNLVVKPVFDDVRSFSEGYAAAKHNLKWGLIDADGGIVVDYQFDEVGELDGGMAPAKIEGKAGYISATGAWVIPPKFDRCSRFFGALAVVCTGSAYSYIRRDGQAVWTSEAGATVQWPPVRL